MGLSDAFNQNVKKRTHSEASLDNSGSNAQGAPKSARPERHGLNDMSIVNAGGSGPTPTPGPQVQARTAGGGGATNQYGSHETPVVWHQPDFGFKEIHTTVIPTTFYLSYNKLDHKYTTKNKLEIRMNSPYDPFVNEGDIVVQTAGGAIAEGPSVTQANNNSTGNSASTLLTFPVTYTTSHKPRWLS